MGTVERMKWLRDANSMLWLCFPEILKEADPCEYEKIMDQINTVETEIGWVARDLAREASVCDLGYRQDCLASLFRLRIKNNTLWMRLLEKTYDLQPEICRAIMAQIAENDRDILHIRTEEVK